MPLSHPNIVRYLGTECDTNEGVAGGGRARLNIFLEYVSGGSIQSLIASYGALDEPVVKRYTHQ
ncbi:hypothetical protein T484DRAFT_1795273, partial [Baffinella frigidus]